MSLELKIKSKHLSLESQVIRFEERKLKKQIEWCKNNNSNEINIEKFNLIEKYTSLSNHRKYDVRNENRATFLTRAFIDNIPYLNVENKRKLENETKFVFIIPRIVSMVSKYKFNKKISYKNNPTEYLEMLRLITNWIGLDFEKTKSILSIWVLHRN